MGETKEVYDYRKLKGKIKEKCGTQDNFAKLIGVGRVTLSKRLNNNLEFSQSEIMRACHVLDLPTEDLAEYFFTERV